MRRRAKRESRRGEEGNGMERPPPSQMPGSASEILQGEAI